MVTSAFVRFWILLSAVVVSAGWILSGLHQLNRAGYAVFFGLAGLALFIWCRQTGWQPRKGFGQLWRQSLKRFRRPAPLIFLIIVLMSLIGGALYAPTNTDTNAYRTPRVWEWLGAEHWHWIRTLDVRMNISAMGFEWLTAPLMVFTGTDRYDFLVNLISYLLLPGLTFSVFIRLGVARRVAWWWAWILASGWCYAIQASSVVNDSFVAVYAVAAVDLALRAREKNSAVDLGLSLLAVAMMTGCKQTAIPLALAWLVAAWPARGLVFRRPLVLPALAAVALLASAVPNIYFNLKHTGAWTGLRPHLGFQYDLWMMCDQEPPFWALAGNVFCLPLQNLVPPFFPGCNAWNGLMQRFVHTSFGSHFDKFESFGRLPMSISEYDAGIGLGVTLLAVISIVAAYRLRRVDGERIGVGGRTVFWVRAAVLLALLVFMAKVATFFSARHLAPYYVLLFPLFLFLPGHAALVRKVWWRRLAVGIMVLTLPMLVFSRHRPLFPALAILEKLQQSHPHSGMLDRAWNRFSYPYWIEQQRVELRQRLPAEFTVIGYLAYCADTEPDLWLPFQKRHVIRFLPGDTPDQIRAAGIRYIVIQNDWLGLAKMTMADLLKKFDGELIYQAEYIDPNGPVRVYLVKLNG